LKYFFETYGCQMNSAESAALDLVCRERGWQRADDAETADLVLLNTCSVRATAEKRVFGRLALYENLKKKRRSRPFSLVVAGCMAQRLGEDLKKKFPGVDHVMGTMARSLFPFILEEAEKGAGNAVLSAQAETPVFTFSSSHLEEGAFRSFVPIMHGCDNFCSYCVVPHVRGREISRDPQSIIDELRLVAGKGVREVTLLGQNVNSYKYGDLDFPALLRLISGELEQGDAGASGIGWVRFLSANPKDFSPQTIQVMAEHPCFCRHIHLPVQHGSDRVLKGMNRRYTRAQYLDLVSALRKAMPGITVSTDILVGFPGETEEDLGQTLELMEDVRFLYAYMYHYNPREGTAAYDLPNRISEELKRDRLSRVIALQKKHTAGLLKSRLGSTERVLIEGISRKNADELITRTEKDEMAVVPGKVSMIGSFAVLNLSGLRGNTFRAREIGELL
jgi:tRNA-2-methylthio-N6-dimethylallyladenosine synthase